jgi:hypothetical protein
MGLVSRVTPIQTAMRNRTGDEGRPFEFDNRVLISGVDLKPAQAAVVKRYKPWWCALRKVGTRFRQGTIERGERKQTVGELSKAD